MLCIGTCDFGGEKKNEKIWCYKNVLGLKAAARKLQNTIISYVL